LVAVAVAFPDIPNFVLFTIDVTVPPETYPGPVNVAPTGKPLVCHTTPPTVPIVT
jgi:hypothetical protein